MTLTFQKGRAFLPKPITGELALPSLPARARNFTRSVARGVVSQARGNPRNVTEATRDARRAKCVANVCGKYRASDGRCAHPLCGCPVSKRGLIESKTELFHEFCPNNPTQWGPGEHPGAANGKQ